MFEPLIFQGLYIIGFREYTTSWKLNIEPKKWWFPSSDSSWIFNFCLDAFDIPVLRWNPMSPPSSSGPWDSVFLGGGRLIGRMKMMTLYCARWILKWNSRLQICPLYIFRNKATDGTYGSKLNYTLVSRVWLWFRAKSTTLELNHVSLSRVSHQDKHYLRF